jgi:alanine racemase
MTPAPHSAGTAGGLLTIDLDAIVANWRLLRERMGAGRDSAAVVKADAYGLGAGPVARTLAAAGCGRFFVALPAEGVALRAVLPDHPIHVLSGPFADTLPLFAAHRLRPVLNTPEQVAEWLAQGPPEIPYGVHVDTGMNRLGLSLADFESLADRIDPEIVISHLACADEAGHPLTAAQVARFRAVRHRLPRAIACLANSSGHFIDGELGDGALFDLGRPGVALYGGNPRPGTPNPMRQVVTLQLKILQVRRVDTPGTVGYGATRRVGGGTRLATVAAGYADGLPRSLSNAGWGLLGDVRVPVAGRVSMDLITFDVTAAAEPAARPGGEITLLDHRHTVDDLATEAGTIPYEILTSLGRRYGRRYLGGAGAGA